MSFRRKNSRKAWSANAVRWKAVLRIEQAKAAEARWEREVRADAIRFASKLPPFESGRFVQVQDITRLADEVEAGKD